MTETAASPTLVTLVTPEQVPLDFRVARHGARIWALFLDLCIIVGLVAVPVVLAVLALPVSPESLFGGVLWSLVLLALFLVRNFYFIVLELHWSGRTVGKRAAGIRVISRDGGPLTADAVLARNLTRDFEVFLPIQLLFSQAGMLGLPAGAWATLTVLWVLVLVALPLFNRHHARLGDLLAGTLVVATPKRVLREDLTHELRAGAPATPRYTFSPEQLDIYGVYELQVLEKVLRGETDERSDELLLQVAERVKRKIDWPRDRWQVDSQQFLRDFYTAQRGRLEKEMLFGRQRERKDQ